MAGAAPAGAIAEGAHDAQAQYGEKAFRRPVRDAGDGLDPNSIPVDVNAIPLGTRFGKKTAEAPVVPDVEWWDAALLPGTKGEQQYEVAQAEDGSEVPPRRRPHAWREPAQRAPCCSSRAGCGCCCARSSRAGTCACAPKTARASARCGRANPGGGPLQVVAFTPEAITLYIQHPVAIQPPAEEQPPAAMPLMLTKKVRARAVHCACAPPAHVTPGGVAPVAWRLCASTAPCAAPGQPAGTARPLTAVGPVPQEQKKLRKQRREAKEKEKQTLIRQGLLEPPKPKVSFRLLACIHPAALEEACTACCAARSLAVHAVCA